MICASFRNIIQRDCIGKTANRVLQSDPRVAKPVLQSDGVPTSLLFNKIFCFFQNLPLKSGSTSFEAWEKSEADLFIEYYVFNVTNTNVANGGIPEIKQLGPYTYRYYK